MDQRPKCKPRNYKTPRRKHRQNTLGHSLEILLLDQSPQVKETKANINKWDLLTLESFVQQRNHQVNKKTTY